MNKVLPTNWTDREKSYSELSDSLGQVDSRNTVVETDTDKDEMEEIVDEEEDVENVEEGGGEGEGEEEEEGEGEGLEEVPVLDTLFPPFQSS